VSDVQTKRRSSSAKTREVLLGAASDVLRDRGYAGFSTREVTERAGVPLSLIHYHFGTKSGLIVALFEYHNAQLLDRQTAMYGDPSLTLSQQWNLACDYLNEDIRSGYVRVYMELWAGGWSDQGIATVVKDAAKGWLDLLTDVAKRAEAKFGSLGPFSANEVAALVGASFVGAEAFILVGLEGKRSPIRQALRKFGKVIEAMERQSR
jgi:AcrR family transcriptional regulator